jgi:hypothetical protein
MAESDGFKDWDPPTHTSNATHDWCVIFFSDDDVVEVTYGISTEKNAYKYAEAALPGIVDNNLYANSYAIAKARRIGNVC